MNRDQFYETKQAVEMLVSAFCDVEQTLNNFSSPEEEDVFSDPEDSAYWHPATDRAPEGKRVVVVTKSGTVFFDTAINGRLLPNVKWWLELPEIPE